MARLPKPGEFGWGDILNDYLLTTLDSDGKVRAGSISEAQLDHTTRSKLDLAVAIANTPEIAAMLSGGAVSASAITRPTSRIKLAAAATTVNSVNGRSGVVTLTKTDVGLANVSNTSDANKPISTATQTALNAKAATTHTHTVSQLSNATATGQALMTASSATSARAAIGAGSSNLVIGTTSTTALAGDYQPTKDTVGLSDVDNTSDYNKPVSAATQAALDEKANSTDTVHTEGDETINGSKNFIGQLQMSGQDLVVSDDSRLSDERSPIDGSVTATKLAAVDPTIAGQVLSYDGTDLVWITPENNGGTPTAETAPDASATTKGIVRLAGDLSGTADSPTVPGLTTKEPVIAPGTTSQYYRGDKSWQPLNKTAVGLTNVDNTSDLDKPISNATQAALSAIQATGGSTGTPLLLIANAAALPAGTPAGTVVVVKA